MLGAWDLARLLTTYDSDQSLHCIGGEGSLFSLNQTKYLNIFIHNCSQGKTKKKKQKQLYIWRFKRKAYVYIHSKTPHIVTVLWPDSDDVVTILSSTRNLVEGGTRGGGTRGYMKWPIFIGLRVRAFFHKTVWVCHVYCNFKIGFTCRITIIFGTLKDGSLLISTLASNITFSYRNIFQNGVDTLPKIVDAFLSKSSNFHLVRIIR